MKDSYTFGPVTVRRALLSERAKLATVCIIARLQRDGSLATQKTIENIRDKNSLKEHDSLYPLPEELRNPNLFTYVAETPPYESAFPVFACYGRQLSGLCSNCVSDHDKENQWKIGWFFPEESPYHTAECLLAASILQAKELEASALTADAIWPRQTEFFENKGLFYHLPHADKLILADYHYDAVLDHLSRKTGYNFNL